MPLYTFRHLILLGYIANANDGTPKNTQDLHEVEYEEHHEEDYGWASPARSMSPEPEDNQVFPTHTPLIVIGIHSNAFRSTKKSTLGVTMMMMDMVEEEEEEGTTAMGTGRRRCKSDRVCPPAIIE